MRRCPDPNARIQKTEDLQIKIEVYILNTTHLKYSLFYVNIHITYAVRNFIFDVKIHVTIALLFIILREFASKVPNNRHNSVPISNLI